MKQILSILLIALLLPGCATTNPTVAKVQAWNQSPGGQATLGLVATAAELYAPQYAGVIGLAANSLMAPQGSPQSVPTAAQLTSAFASVTGSKTTDPRIATLASAVLKAAQTAPSPNAGLAQAAATVNATAQPNS